MRILYVNPALRPEARVRYFPIGAGFVISALVREGFQVDLADMDAHRLEMESVAAIAGSAPYDIVFLGAIVTGYRIVKELARTLRKVLPQAVIVAGNSVASSIAATLLTRTEVDVAVLGEGEATAVDLARALSVGRDISGVAGVAYLEGGSLRTTAKRKPIADISAIPMIDYSLFDTPAYVEASRFAVLEPFPMPLEEIRPFAVNTARGCIADCTFCYHVFKGQPYRYRSEASIMAEAAFLAETYGVNYFFLHDDLSLFSKPRAQRLAEAIFASGLRMHWWGTCRAGLFDSTDDVSLLDDLKRSGCVGLSYSLENASPEILQAMNKRITPEEFVRQAGLLEKVGLSNYTSLVFGYPQETEDTIAKTFDTCIQARVCPSVGYLLPLPGSVMYAYCLDRGIILDEEDYFLRLGDRQDLRINLTAMPDDEFEGCVNHHVERLNKALGIQADSEDLLRNERYKSAVSEHDVPASRTSPA